MTEGRIGDDRQVLALARALGTSVREIVRRPGVARVVLDRLVDLVGSRSPDAPGPWPDVLIVVGGRNVSFARRVRRASGGRCRVVLIGRPWWAAMASFDLIVTTPQYGLPAAANVLSNPLPLNAADPSATAAAGDTWRGRFATLPRPWIGVLVGGPSGSHRMDAADIRRLAERLATIPGTPLLVTSRRTPAHLAAQLFDAVRDPAYRHAWRPESDDNPLQGILALADRFVVTGESASMIAEASNTGRPVEVFPLPMRPLARLLAALNGPWCHGLVRRGLWLPARDMRRLHAALAEIGTGPRVDLDLARTAAHIRARIGCPDPSPATSNPAFP